MTEQQELALDLAVERKIDRLDRELMSGNLEQAEYDLRIEEIIKWARRKAKEYRLSARSEMRK